MLFKTVLALFLVNAPVPKHLMKDPPEVVVPGLVWRTGGNEYMVLRVDGETVVYTCVSNPNLQHAGLDGHPAEAFNHQSKARTRQEMKSCPQPGDGYPHN